MSSIGPDQAALIRRRVSVIVISRDHLMRAMGCRLSDDLREVMVFLSASSSQKVLDDLRSNGLIAVVFSEPSSNLTVQLKGLDAAAVPTQPADHGLLARRHPPLS
jgi:general stress protein 26